MARPMLAVHDSICQRCDAPILRGQAIVRHRGGYIHRHCASGFDDE